MKYTTLEVQNSYNKALLVIDSCKTIKQLHSAQNYINVFQRTFIFPIYRIRWSDNMSTNTKKHRLAWLDSLRMKYNIKDYQLKKS